MNETLHTLHSLRTIHGDFSEREVSPADLEQVIAACLRAASSSARQPFSIIVLDDRAQMKELFGYQGSRALVFCVDFSRIEAAARFTGHEFNNNEIISFITASVDTSLAAQTAVIAAKALGIDSLITNGLHRNSFDKVYAALNLPQSACFPLITVVLGYPNHEPAHQKGRLSPEFIVHYGEHHALTEEQLARMAAEYDDHDRRIGLVDNWEAQGFARYLDWFFEKWTGKPAAERIAAGKVLEFQQRLRQSGFWWEEEQRQARKGS